MVKHRLLLVTREKTIQYWHWNSLERICFLSAKGKMSHRGGADVAPRREWLCVAEELRSAYGDLAKGLHRINSRDWDLPNLVFKELIFICVMRTTFAEVFA